ncbi:MAG: sigma-54 dependent transcriptional regulator [Gammaproteobacteria bacterium]|nr:sigma-54 dependent transcriptional regulator [Gammaproteobacteria bacterium]
MTTRTSGNLLVVDDDRDVLLSAQMILKREFANVRCLSNPSELSNELTAFPPDLVLLDMNFTRGMTSGEEGLYWLQKIKQTDPGIQVVMSTAYGEIDLAVRAIKLGAADFVQKPWVNEKLVATLRTCLKLGESHRRIEQLQHTQQALSEELGRGFAALIGESDSFAVVRSLINRVAATDANVLITGENGTGKDLVAHAIHNKSLRASGPMISVDIGAIPATLFESEMFGYNKGAFTDARENRPGKFELATGGTLFLDEIGNLEANTQAKLLRALESRTITRVGGQKPMPINLRLICATNASIRDLSNPDIFRRDLLYRINTVEIRLPSLRERTADIPLLLEHYLHVFAQKYNRPEVSIPKTTARKLQSYEWPGNVRELKHAVERAIIISSEAKLTVEDFLIGTRVLEEPTGSLNLAELERNAISNAIRQCEGNLTQVAKLLGLGRTTLYRKMEKYELVDQ